MHAPFYTHEFLDTPTIAHGFFGRAGGVSEGLYEGLNCGPGSHDNKAHVVENRARVAHALQMEPEKLCTLYQIHSANVIIVHEPFIGTPPQADAQVTNIPGITLGILTADCAPVLFADAEAGVIGAAHAGWKGAHGNIVENTLNAMEKLGADRANIVAVIGPSIAQISYEVGPEFIDRFTPADQQQFFIKSNREGFHRFDLPSYVAQTARRAGLQRIAMLAMDTASNPAQFFSYRRSTLHAEPDYGRQISAIALKN
ncbi:MAG: peptidoglycan editing factor PgeF [Rickettsiales bacterium]